MEERRRDLVRELTEIVEFVEKGDAQGASRAMKRHLRGVRGGIRKLKGNIPLEEQRNSPAKSNDPLVKM
jgi:DNA-binding GntR family transcriptional regulator